MKKILFLLLIAVSSYGQTLQNPTYGNTTTNTLKIKTPTTVSTVNFLSTNEADGSVSKIAPINVNIPYMPVNYSAPTQTIGNHLAGIDTRLGQISSTSAGLTQRVDFTADNTVVNAVTYFASSLSGKGSTATGSPPALVLPDNTKAFFTKDVISIAQISPTIGYAGVYSGNLTVSASPTPVATKQRFTVEIYRTNNLGVPIASGVSGAIVGDLGVTVLAVLDSGELNLTAGSITNIPVSGRLTQNVTINTGERLRYHVSAAKIGTGGGNVTFGVYYGSSYNSYYDVPVAITTDAVLNKTPLTGVNLTDVINNLNSEVSVNNIVHKTGDENITSGIKRWFGQARFGLSDLGSFITTGRHLTQFNAADQQTPLIVSGGNSSIEYFKDLLVPRYAWATGLQNPSSATIDYEPYNAYRFYLSKNVAYVKVAEIGEEGNIFTKGNLSENITELTPTISGQLGRIRYVNSLNTTQPVKLVIYFHGSGTNQLNPFTDTGSKYIIDKLLSEGYIVATSEAHGNAWGNQASQDDYLALYNYIIANYNINDVVFVGHSMGGITSLNMIAKNAIPAVSRWYGIYPATNLNEAYFTEGFASAIETAYGFTGSANYAAATAGNDPQLYAGNAYANKKYTMTASAGDLTIIKTTNADLFNTKLTGASISSYIVTATGLHGDISHFIPKHIFSFFRGTTVVKASQNVLTRVNNAGDLVDSAILDDGVNVNLSRNYRLTNSTPTSSLINSASSNKRWDTRISANDFQIVESGVATRLTLIAGGGAVVSGALTATSYTGDATLTGTPTAPTATAGTNTAQIATTAFVQAAIGTSGTYNPTFIGVTNVSSGTAISNATYTKIGNIVTVNCSANITATVSNTNTIFTMTLPINRATSSTLNLGTGTVLSGGSSNNFSSLVQSSSTTTVSIRYFPSDTGTNTGSFIFQYDITK